MTATAQRVFVLSVLALLMMASRAHPFEHFTPPDASWAAFFIGGFYLRGWSRWAFPLLMALAVAIDVYAIQAQGLSFWQHYCVSPAYWCLVPAYLALWLGGAWLGRGYVRADLGALARLAAALLAAVAVCQLIAQGSFYWISRNVADPTLAGWWKNYSDWLLPYLGTAAAYVGIAAALQLGAERIAPLLPHGRDRTAG